MTVMISFLTDPHINTKKNANKKHHHNHHHHHQITDANTVISPNKNHPHRTTITLSNSSSSLPISPSSTSDSDSTLPNNTNATPTMLLAGLLGACFVTASFVSVAFFICLKRRLKAQDNNNDNDTSSSSRATPTTNTSPACLIRPQMINHHPQMNTKWLSPSDLITSSSVVASQQHHHQKESTNPFIVNESMLAGHHHQQGNNNPYANLPTMATFWNELMATPPSTTKSSYASAASTSSNLMTTKGSDVSPYAYASIVVCPSNQNNKMPHPPSLPSQPPPPLSSSDWPPHSEEGHIYDNHLYHGGGESNFSEGTTTRNTSSTLGSLVQIDGFQCRKKQLMREVNVEERFL
jgi:hypothetical protein